MNALKTIIIVPSVFLASIVAGAKPMPQQPPLLPKHFCQIFEAMEAEVLGTCPAAAQDRPAVKARIAASQRAVQQCRELLEFAASEKRVKLDQYYARLCIAARQAFLNSPDPNARLRLAVRDSCVNTLAGQRADGAACESASECRHGLTCLHQGASLTGSCGKPLPANTACNDEAANDSAFYEMLRLERAVCTRGMSCINGPGGFKCRPRTAAPPRGMALCR